MGFEPARPRYTLPFAGKDYDLLGTMELIEAVEFALKRGITQITVDVMNGMPTHELVRVLSAVLTAGGHKISAGRRGGHALEQGGRGRGKKISSSASTSIRSCRSVWPPLRSARRERRPRGS